MECFYLFFRMFVATNHERYANESHEDLFHFSDRITTVRPKKYWNNWTGPSVTRATVTV